MYPNADVYIGENDIICIVNKSMYDISNREDLLRSTYAPNGGSYRNFKIPTGWSPDAGIPYSMVFLPADKTVALLNARLKSSLISSIVSLLVNHSASAVSSIIASTYGVTLSPSAILFLSGIGTYSAITWLDTAALTTATNNNSKICITRTMVYGYPSDIYTGWSGNYVVPNPYSAFNPVFRKSVYDVSY